MRHTSLSCPKELVLTSFFHSTVLPLHMFSNVRTGSTLAQLGCGDGRYAATDVM